MSNYASEHTEFRQTLPTNVLTDFIVQGYLARGGVIPDDAQVKVLFSVSEGGDSLIVSLLIRTLVDGPRVVPVDVKRLSFDLGKSARNATLERYKHGN